MDRAYLVYIISYMNNLCKLARSDLLNQFSVQIKLAQRFTLDWPLTIYITYNLIY